MEPECPFWGQHWSINLNIFDRTGWNVQILFFSQRNETVSCSGNTVTFSGTKFPLWGQREALNVWTKISVKQLCVKGCFNWLKVMLIWCHWLNQELRRGVNERIHVYPLQDFTTDVPVTVIFEVSFLAS